MYEGNGSTAQKFEFEKIEELIGKKTIEEGKYKIKAGTNEKLGFDVESNSKESVKRKWSKCTNMERIRIDKQKSKI